METEGGIYSWFTDKIKRAQKEDFIPSLHIREHRRGKFISGLHFIYKSTERGTLSLAYK